MGIVGIAAGLLMLTTGAGQASGQASDAAYEQAVTRIFALVEAAQSVEGASPALAVVAVRAEGPPQIWVRGAVQAGGPVAADADTPFYIASMTKSYMGLLAAELDRRGVLPLDTRLDAIWPGLRVEGVPAAGATTLRDLLTHRVPFRNGALSFRTAYTDEPSAAEYRFLLERHSTPQDAAFTYSNLGYLLYGAAVEQRTGRHWRAVLTDEILTPLGLSRTSPYPSRFAPGTAAGGHQWLLDGFTPAPLKADPLMHAAGGLVASPADMARWLQAWLRGSGGSIPAASFEAAALRQVDSPPEGSAVRCDGYSLGWLVCSVAGADLRVHGGGYTGVRSSMAWSKDLGAGFAVLSNSDSMTGGLSQGLTALFFAVLADPEAELPSPERFAEQYAEQVRGLAEGRRRQVIERIAEERWGGWRWDPAAAELDAYAGDYDHPRLGRMRVEREGGGLVLRLGEMRMALEPAQPGLFGGAGGPLDAPDPVRFDRDASGRPVALEWDGDRFVRSGG